MTSPRPVNTLLLVFVEAIAGSTACNSIGFPVFQYAD